MLPLIDLVFTQTQPFRQYFSIMLTSMTGRKSNTTLRIGEDVGRVCHGPCAAFAVINLHDTFAVLERGLLPELARVSDGESGPEVRLTFPAPLRLRRLLRLFGDELAAWRWGVSEDLVEPLADALSGVGVHVEDERG